jgi:hypothetical protein
VAALERLVARGLVMLAGVTPSDASHVLGRLDAWDGVAAEKAVRLLARRRTGRGERFAPDAATLAQGIVDQLTAQTVDCLLEAAFGEDAAFAGQPPEALARHPLTMAGLDGHRGVVQISARLGVPVIGLGASAAGLLRRGGRPAGHADDPAGTCRRRQCDRGRGGAGGAARDGPCLQPRRGALHRAPARGAGGLCHRDAALDALEAALIAEATRGPARQGPEDLSVTLTRDIREAEVEGRAMFIEATLTATASGRPRVAHG